MNSADVYTSFAAHIQTYLYGKKILTAVEVTARQLLLQLARNERIFEVAPADVDKLQGGLTLSCRCHVAIMGAQ